MKLSIITILCSYLLLGVSTGNNLSHIILSGKNGGLTTGDAWDSKVLNNNITFLMY